MQRFLVPVSTVSARNAWHNDLPFVTQNLTKNSGEILPEKLGGGVLHASRNPYPISDQNMWFSLPNFRPDKKFDTLFQTWSPGARRVTGAREKLLRHVPLGGTYTVVGVNIKREKVLSPNDEEVANSSKKHTQFKTRVLKLYPISDQNGRNWYPISIQTKTAKNHTFGAAHTYIAYTQETIKGTEKASPIYTLFHR